MSPLSEHRSELAFDLAMSGMNTLDIAYKVGGDFFDVSDSLVADGLAWDAKAERWRWADEIVEQQKPKRTEPKAEFKRVQKGGSIVLEDFRALEPADEKWFACKHPFSSYAVSSYARVARLVGKPGVPARKVLRPRTRFNFKTRQSELVVQLRNDAGKKLDYSVKWLFENHRPKTPAEIARRQAAAERKAEREA